jgi:hypothetical protein
MYSNLILCQLPIIVETDCSQLVTLINSKEADRAPLLHIVSEIKHLFSGIRKCVFVKVERGQIRASHFLASFAILDGCTEFWLGSDLKNFFSCYVTLPEQ